MSIRPSGRLDGRLFLQVLDDGELVKLRCLEEGCGAEFADRNQFVGAKCPSGAGCGLPKPKGRRPKKQDPKKEG